MEESFATIHRACCRNIKMRTAVYIAHRGGFFGPVLRIFVLNNAYWIDLEVINIQKSNDVNYVFKGSSKGLLR